MAGSPYIAIPDAIANFGSVLNTLAAIKQNVNLLIVNSQSTAQSPNLGGANVFQKTFDTKITGLSNQIATLTTQVTSLNKQIDVLTTILARHNIQ